MLGPLHAYAPIWFLCLICWHHFDYTLLSTVRHNEYLFHLFALQGERLTIYLGFWSGPAPTRACARWMVCGQEKKSHYIPVPQLPPLVGYILTIQMHLSIYKSPSALPFHSYLPDRRGRFCRCQTDRRSDNPPVPVEGLDGDFRTSIDPQNVKSRLHSPESKSS